jgi:ferritin-like metal-binding protein YciE
MASTLHELYISELQDLYDAEQQILGAVAALAAKAADADLKRAFERHLERGRIHVERLEWLFVERNLPKTTGRTTAIEALIRDADRRVHTLEDPYVRDAALIAAAQLVAHYEIAAYGCTRTYAQLLGDNEAADLLQQTLDDEREADEELTQIATIINGMASPDRADEWRPASSLRYVRVNDLERAAEGDAGYEIRSSSGGPLGTVEGLLVDASARAAYVVIGDMGGLFVGRRRFAVPIEKIDRTGSRYTFMIDFDQEQLHRYPPFHPEGFATLTGEEIQQFARLSRPGGGHVE